MKAIFLRETGTGKGVFANRGFRKSEEIICFKGKLLSHKQLPVPYDSVDDHFVQIGPKLYMGPSGKPDDFINHSCNPNSGLKIIGKKIILVAVRKIKTGEEICWDYSTTMDEDDWEMECECGSIICRRIVRDFKHLPIGLQKKYLKLEIVPDYIIKSLK